MPLVTQCKKFGMEKQNVYPSPERVICDLKNKYLPWVGNTELIEIPTDKNDARLFAKCEWQNRFGSIKDRPALAMLLREIELCPQLITCEEMGIIEYSGGYLALALAKLCQHAKINLTLALPHNIEIDFQIKLKRLGAKVLLAPANTGFIGAIDLAKKLAYQNKNLRFLHQHQNTANLLAHQHGTADEIISQLANYGVSYADAFVASIGTGATLIGTSLGLRRFNRFLSVYATSPAEMPFGTQAAPNNMPKFSGSGGLGYGIKQYFVAQYEWLIKEHFTYTLEACYQQSKAFHDEMMRNEYIGTSAAANLMAAKAVAKQLGKGKVVVTVFPSLLNEAEIERVKNHETKRV